MIVRALQRERLFSVDVSDDFGFPSDNFPLNFATKSFAGKHVFMACHCTDDMGV